MMNHQDFLKNAAGNVFKEWQLKTVDELISDGILEKIQDGNHGGDHPTSKDYHQAGVPFLMSGVIREGKIDWPQVKYITLEHAKSLRVGHSKKNDVLLTHKGNDLGRVAILENCDYAILTPQITYYRIGDDKRLNRYFLKYYFESPQFQFQFKRDSQQSTRPFVSITNQKSLVIPLPPTTQQLHLVDLLKPIDDKIQHNAQAIETLEAIAKATFKEWFIDFGPLKARAEGRKPFGMDNETASLFPDSFDETEHGQIPKGWSLKSLDEVASYLNGLALQKFPPKGIGDLPVIKIAQLRANSAKGADLANNSLPSEYVIDDGDIVFSWSGTLEVKIWTGGKGALNQHLFKVTSKEYPKWFYWLATLSHLDFFRGVAASKATTMGHIQRSHLREAKIACPDFELIKRADSSFSPIFEQLVLLSIESRHLENVRDLFLPKLIAGEISI